jgi:hypothetical protein
VFPELAKEDEPLEYRRIDHILSDITVKGKRIVMNIQKGDKFSNGIKVVIPTMNSTLMKKEKNMYFDIEYVDYL